MAEILAQIKDRRTGLPDRRRGRGWARAAYAAGYTELAQPADLAILAAPFWFLVLAPGMAGPGGQRALPASVAVFLLCLAIWALTLRYSGVYRKKIGFTTGFFLRALLALNTCTLAACVGAQYLQVDGDLWTVAGLFWIASLLGMALLRVGLLAFAVTRERNKSRRAPVAPGRVIAFPVPPGTPAEIS